MCFVLAKQFADPSWSIRTVVSSPYGHFFQQCDLQVLGYVNLKWLSCNWETLRQKDKFSAIYFPHFWELEYISIWFDIRRYPGSNISSGWDRWFPLVLSIAPYSLWYFGRPWTLLLPWLTCFTCLAVYISSYRLSFRIRSLHIPAISPWETRMFLSSVHLFFLFFKPSPQDRFLALLSGILSPPTHLVLYLITTKKIQRVTSLER